MVRFDVKAACEEHLPGIAAIYNHTVEHMTAIWNDALVDVENRRGWWRGRVEAEFPVLVAVDAGGAVLGYASYGPFRAFDGYRLHEKLGFVETARMPQVGRKFGRWLDLVFMQKVLQVSSGRCAAPGLSAPM